MELDDPHAANVAAATKLAQMHDDALPSCAACAARVEIRRMDWPLPC